MKFTINSKIFATALATAATFSASAEKALPVLKHIKIVATGNNEIRMYATDLGHGCMLTIPAKVTEVGKVMVPKQFGEVAATLAGDTSVNVNEKTFRVTIGADGAKGKSELKTLDPDEASPIIIPEDGTIVLELPGTEWLKAIDAVSYASSTDGARPVLTGINISVNRSEVIFAATDGYSLAFKRVVVSEAKKQGSVIVPAASLVKMKKIISESAMVKMILKNGYVYFIGDGVAFLVSSIEGTFPDYSKITPNITADNVKHCRMNTRQFKSAVKIANVFFNGVDIKTIGVVPVDDNKDVDVQVVGNENGAASTKVPYSGDLTGFRVNVRYLARAIDSVVGEEVIIHTRTNPKAPLAITDSDDSITRVLMPVSDEFSKKE